MGPTVKYDLLKSSGVAKSAWRPRRWRGHWLQCCGEWSPEDAVGCCLGCSNPCGVAYSWNVSKVLHLSFWRELLKYVAVILLIHYIYNIVYWNRLYACYMKPFFVGMASAASGRTHVDPVTIDQMVDQCAGASILQLVTVVIAVICLICWALFIGGKRRRQMREELGIPISAEGRCCSICHNNGTHFNDDCCLHFWCMPCALAQETRTILHEEAIGSLPVRLAGGGARADLAAELLAVAPDEMDDMQRSALPV